MTFQLPQLPYAVNALEPHISRRTMEFHHDKHHAGYVTKLNDLVEGKRYAKLDLEQIMLESAKKREDRAIFNNAAQAWNHDFFWHGMRPGGGGEPSGDIASRLRDDFGGYEGLRQAFVDTAVGQFGSGWAWLAFDGGKLVVTSTSDAINPLVTKQVPLLTCDVWEHAYYLDYQNRRKAFVEAFFDYLINWDEVQARFAEALAGKRPRTVAAERQ